MTPDLWVALAVGLSGAGAAVLALVANRDGRKATTGASVVSMMTQLADELRDELERERKHRKELERRVVQLERQLYRAGISPDPPADA